MTELERLMAIEAIRQMNTGARGTWALEDRFVWPEGSSRRTMHGFVA